MSKEHVSTVGKSKASNPEAPREAVSQYEQIALYPSGDEIISRINVQICGILERRRRPTHERRTRRGTHEDQNERSAQAHSSPYPCAKYCHAWKRSDSGNNVRATQEPRRAEDNLCRIRKQMRDGRHEVTTRNTTHSDTTTMNAHIAG